MAGRYPLKGETAPEGGIVAATYSALTGEKIDVEFPIKGTVIDFNGDGVHEIYADGALYDRLGRKILSIGKSTLVLAKHILPYGGEQLVVAMPDGKINFWTDANAVSSARYDSDIYRANVRQSSSGYNHRYPVLE